MSFDTKEAEDLFNIENNNIDMLREQIVELNRIIATQNDEKYSSKINITTKNLMIEEIPIEAFSTTGGMFTKIIVSKHVSSDYVSVSFLPNEGKILQVFMTEKSYMKFDEVVDVFKLKYIDTRKFE